MGEIAEMMLDGTLDSVTGEYLGEPCGYPRSITDGTFHQDRNKLQRKASQSIRDLCRNLLGVTDKNMIDQLLKSLVLLEFLRSRHSTKWCFYTTNQISNSSLWT